MLIIDSGSEHNGHKHHVLTVSEANSEGSDGASAAELEQVLSVGQL